MELKPPKYIKQKPTDTQRYTSDYQQVYSFVIRPRLERGTVCLEGRCSIQLSYRTPFVLRSKVKSFFAFIQNMRYFSCACRVIFICKSGMDSIYCCKFAVSAFASCLILCMN